MRHEMVRARLDIHVESMLPVKSDRALVVLDDVEPHRPIGPEPIHSSPHQRVGNAAPVEGRVDHQPIQLAVVRRVDRRDYVAGEPAIDEGRAEQLMLVPASVHGRFRGNPNDPAIGFDLLGREAVTIEGRGGGPLGEGGDVVGAKAHRN